MNLNAVSIFDLSPPEKLQLVEDLRDDLAATLINGRINGVRVKLS